METDSSEETARAKTIVSVKASAASFASIPLSPSRKAGCAHAGSRSAN